MTGISESVFTSGANKELVGILCRPSQSGQPPKPGIIFLNAGNTHHVGPNRIYVTLSRALARKGFPCVRFDFSGLGDSLSKRDGRRFRDYAPLEVRQVLDDLVKSHGMRRFVVVGICGGADIAVDAACDDGRIVGAVLINGAFLDGEAFAGAYQRASRRTLARFYRRRLLSPLAWARLVSLRSGFWRILVRTMRHGLGRLHRGVRAEHRTPMKEAKSKWVAMAERGMEVLMIFAEGSIFRDMFLHETSQAIRAVYRPDNLQVVMQEGADHTFTLLTSQRTLKESVLQWLGRITRKGIQIA